MRPIVDKGTSGGYELDYHALLADGIEIRTSTVRAYVRLVPESELE